MDSFTTPRNIATSQEDELKSSRVRAAITLRFIALVGLLCPVHLGLSQTSDPLQVPSRTILTNGAIYFRPPPVLPPDPQPHEIHQSPSPTKSFGSLAGGPSGVPDTHGSVSSNFVMSFSNRGAIIHTKDGNTVVSNTLKGFWTSTNIASFTNIADPKAQFDPFAGRWMCTGITEDHSSNSTLLVGVSRTTNPTNFGDAYWSLHQVEADPDHAFWVDQPSIGFNKDWLAIQANMGKVPDGFDHSRIFVFSGDSRVRGYRL